MRDLQILIEEPHTVYQAQGWHTEQNPSLSVVGLVEVPDELSLTSGTPWALFSPMAC